MLKNKRKTNPIRVGKNAVALQVKATLNKRRCSESKKNLPVAARRWLANNGAPKHQKATAAGQKVKQNKHANSQNITEPETYSLCLLRTSAVKCCCKSQRSQTHSAPLAVLSLINLPVTYCPVGVDLQNKCDHPTNGLIVLMRKPFINLTYHSTDDKWWNSVIWGNFQKAGYVARAPSGALDVHGRMNSTL